MIVTQNDFGFDFKKREERIAAYKPLLDRGEMSQEDFDYLTDIEAVRKCLGPDGAHNFCFFCGKKLTVPCVMWHGSHGFDKQEYNQIWLHIECAYNIAMHLEKDAGEADEVRLNTPTLSDELGEDLE